MSVAERIGADLALEALEDRIERSPVSGTGAATMVRSQIGSAPAERPALRGKVVR